MQEHPCKSVMKQLLYNSLFSHILRCFSDIYFICSFLFCKLIKFLKVSICSLMLFAEKFFSYTCIVLMRTFITPLLCDTCCSLCRRKRSLTSLSRPVPPTGLCEATEQTEETHPGRCLFILLH